jgi:hypothetical protein
LLALSGLVTHVDKAHRYVTIACPTVAAILASGDISFTKVFITLDMSCSHEVIEFPTDQLILGI